MEPRLRKTVPGQGSPADAQLDLFVLEPVQPALVILSNFEQPLAFSSHDFDGLCQSFMAFLQLVESFGQFLQSLIDRHMPILTRVVPPIQKFEMSCTNDQLTDMADAVVAAMGMMVSRCVIRNCSRMRGPTPTATKWTPWR